MRFVKFIGFAAATVQSSSTIKDGISELEAVLGQVRQDLERESTEIAEEERILLLRHTGTSRTTSIPETSTQTSSTFPGTSTAVPETSTTISTLETSTTTTITETTPNGGVISVPTKGPKEGGNTGVPI